MMAECGTSAVNDAVIASSLAKIVVNNEQDQHDVIDDRSVSNEKEPHNSVLLAVDSYEEINDTIESEYDDDFKKHSGTISEIEKTTTPEFDKEFVLTAGKKSASPPPSVSISIPPLGSKKMCMFYQNVGFKQC